MTDDINLEMGNTVNCGDRMRWISVKNKLPEPGIKKVIVFVPHEHGPIIDMARYLGEQGWDLVSFELWDENVTHWMPLPEPPKEDEPK